MPAHYCASVHATGGVCVCAVLTLFFVLFCSAKQAEIQVQPPPPPDDGLPFVVWYNQPNEGDEAFFGGDDSGGEEEDYSLKKETEEYL